MKIAPAPLGRPALIEPLEGRIAPAAVFTYMDVDGDQVTVHISKGTMADLNGHLTYSDVSGQPRQLVEIDLAHTARPSIFAGANLTVNVTTRGAHGDGLANVDKIDATGLALGTVRIGGNLGAIDCGSGAAGKTALVKLSVESLGVSAQGGPADVQSVLAGNVGALMVEGDVTGAFVHVGAGFNLTSTQIGGSLLGGAGPNSGEIYAEENLGLVSILGEVLAGGAGSGILRSGGKMGPVSIGGSLTGVAANSGVIQSGSDMSTVKIGGSIVGGALASGSIFCGGSLAIVTVGGSVTGGSDANSGEIQAAGDIAAVSIGGNLAGSGANESGKIDAGAGVLSTTHFTGMIGNITLGGSLLGGAGNEDTFADASGRAHKGQIFAVGRIGFMKIGGDVLGAAGDDSATIASAQGGLSALSIAGSLVGAGLESGSVNMGAGTIGQLFIGHDLQGGSGDASGLIRSLSIGQVHLGGSLLGGDGSESGSLDVQATTAVIFVGHDVRGGTKAESGSILSGSNLPGLVIQGSLIGGSGADTGKIFSGGTLDSINIGASLLGGSAPRSGSIFANQNILGVRIGHDVQGGDGNDSGRIDAGASVVAGSKFAGSLGSISIGGSLLGGAGAQDDISDGTRLHQGQIFAVGDIATVTVGGDVRGAAGSFSASVLSAQGNLGALRIGGSLIGSSSSSGASDNGEVVFNAGTIGDIEIGHDLVGGSLDRSGSIGAKVIGTIRIAGSVLGSQGAGVGAGTLAGQSFQGVLAIGGDVRGGGGMNSGSIISGTGLPAITIGGSLIGGSQPGAGEVMAPGNIGGVSLGGSLVGGSSAPNTGSIACGGDLGAVVIGGDVQGGGDAQSGTIDVGASVTPGAHFTGGISSITIRGSLLGGVGDPEYYDGTRTHLGQIFAVGGIGPVEIDGDVRGGNGDFTGSISSGAGIARIEIAGSLVGGAGGTSGTLDSNGASGPITIGHDVRHGSSGSGGVIANLGTLASITIGGTLTASLQITQMVKLISIGGDVQGDSLQETGYIEAGDLPILNIGGSLIGGTAHLTGVVQASQVGGVTIGHDLIGGSVSGGLSLEGAGAILSAHRIASVNLGGSIVSGTNGSTGTLTESGSIQAVEDISVITVMGNVIGHADTGHGASPVVLSAGGQAKTTVGTDVAIGRLFIDGHADHLNVLAGYRDPATPDNSNAQIGSVIVRGDFIASNLVAGVENYGADGMRGTADDNLNFGDANDHLIGLQVTSIAKIASIVIGGAVKGTPSGASATDSFGIVSARLVTLQIDSFTFPITAASPAPLSAATGSDVIAHVV